MKYKPKTKPFPHQSRAVIRAVKKKNYAFFFEPRCGKSKAALDTVGIHALRGDVQRVLIIAPRIALAVWEKQMRLHFPYPAFCEDFESTWSTAKYMGAKVRPDPRSDYTFPTPQFFLAGREETFRRTRDKEGALLPSPREQELERWNPDLVILDESHQYKRPGGRAAQDAWRLVHRLRAKRGDGRPWVLELSGTPNPKGWRDLFAQFRIMDERILGTSAADFDNRHCIYGHGKAKYKIIGYKREKKLLKKIRDHSYAVSAKEAGLEGKRFWNPIYVTLPDKAMKHYLDLIEDMLTEVEGELITAKNAGVLRTRLLQITGGFTTSGKVVHRAKVDATRDWLTLLHEQQEPYIVGCRYTPEVHAVAEAVSKQQRIEIVEGATRKSRDLAIKAFQRGRLDGLIFQVQSGEAAIELSRAAEVINYSFPDGWVSFWQFLQRVSGPNQARPVRYTPILARGTLDKSVVASLRKKEEWHNIMMANPELFLKGLII